MRQKLSSISQKLKLPSICRLCQQFHQGKLSVCAFCIQFIKPLGIACGRCALPLADKHSLLCGECLKKPPHFDATYIAYTFEEPLRSLMHQFKYQQGLFLSKFLVELMLQALPQTIPECLIPVPMHPIRLKSRGFNQAVVLTKLLAKKLQLPYDLTSCKKIINTAPQASLDAEQRLGNIKKSFACAPMPYSHVVIIDDLLTTGSTVNELARTLKNNGVLRVDIWCCARTIKG